jgi:hypothetical protein
MEEGEQKTSRYNAGVAIQIRLDLIWKDANFHARHGEYSKWNMDLDRAWCELARDIKDNEYEDKTIKDKTGKLIKVLGNKSLFDSFDTRLGKLMPFKDDATDDFKKPTEEQKKKRNEQYRLLMEKELFLKRLENHLGKGTAFENEDEDDF